MTFSIVARCARTGQFGVGAATGVPAVGKLLSYAWPRAGAVATQAQLNPYLGLDGVRLLRQGLGARDALELLRAGDPRAEVRQFALIDAQGATAVWTGARCPGWAGHLERADFSVQGNRLAGRAVLESAAAAFGREPDRPLVDRLIAALSAGDAEGGDTKGEVSANVYIVDTEEYPLWDIRVDYSVDPIGDLRRMRDILERELLPDVRRMPTRANPAGQAEDAA